MYKIGDILELKDNRYIIIINTNPLEGREFDERNPRKYQENKKKFIEPKNIVCQRGHMTIINKKNNFQKEEK